MKRHRDTSDNNATDGAGLDDVDGRHLADEVLARAVEKRVQLDHRHGREEQGLTVERRQLV